MKYGDWVDDFESGTIEWNIETACYVLGILFSDYINHQITEKEYDELVKMVPISKEVKDKINW